MNEEHDDQRVHRFRDEPDHIRWGRECEVDHDSKGHWQCTCGRIGRPNLVHEWDDRYRVDKSYRECPCGTREPDLIPLPEGAYGCDGCHRAIALRGSDYCQDCSEADDE